MTAAVLAVPPAAAAGVVGSNSCVVAAGVATVSFVLRVRYRGCEQRRLPGK